jgi:hypothetical protein
LKESSPHETRKVWEGSGVADVINDGDEGKMARKNDQWKTGFRLTVCPNVTDYNSKDRIHE